MLGMLVLAVPPLGCAAAASTMAMTAAITLPPTPRPVNPLIMGCHSDSGYVVQPFGLQSQMVVGESFEGNFTRYKPLDSRRGARPNITWNQLTDGEASFTQDSAAPFHGLASQRIELASGTYAFVSNRGMGNEGLALEGGREYTGYVFARAARPATLTVALRDVTARGSPAKVLASVSLPVAGAGWRRYNYTLTPTASTGCVFIPTGSDPDISCASPATPIRSTTEPRDNTDGPPHRPGFVDPEAGDACQRCGGEFALGLTKPGEAVSLDFAALHPGEWGRFAGLEVRKDAVEMLRSMGVTAMRQGGSFADASYYFWKDWRGRKWERPSFGAFWSWSYESSWGPFVRRTRVAGISSTVHAVLPTDRMPQSVACIGVHRHGERHGDRADHDNGGRSHDLRQPRRHASHQRASERHLGGRCPLLQPGGHGRFG